MQKKIVRRSLPINSDSKESKFSDLKIEGHPLVSRVLAHRGVFSRQALDYSLKNILNPESLKGLDHATDLLVAALESQKKICIVGDFDADGATSTVLCLRALRAFGLQNCDFIVPNRFEYGYGLTPEIVELAQHGKPDLLLTVDNGISSIEGVAAAQRLGMQVLITDHHLPGNTLPAADAIVNPNQPGCDFPSKNLAGVGVAFYLMMALRRKLREINWFATQQMAEPNLANLLDLVALGTVADVVPLDQNNRTLVAQGLRRIRAGECCAGIRALLSIANKTLEQVSSSDLGFALGPRLNAAGRLDDMSLGIQCLLSDNIYEAEKLARQLDDFNRERKAIETGMRSEAMAALDARTGEEDQNCFALSLYDPSWHEGVIGILASRVKERLHRPVIIFAKTQDGSLKGSGRSIPGVHLRDVLDEIASHNSGLLAKFGGHAMAAGLSLEEHQLTRFEKEFNRVVARVLDHRAPQAEILTDGEVETDEFNLESAYALRNAGPWGQAFPEPLFDGVFRLVQQRRLKERHLKMSLTPHSEMRPHEGGYSGVLLEAIAFNVDSDLQLPEGEECLVELVYKLDINEFRGESKLQLLVEQITALPAAS